MRTTLTLDDDLAATLADRAKKLGIPFKQMVNRTLRAGLGEDAAAAGPRIVVEPLDLGPCLLGAEVNFNRLADDLEDEALIAKMRRAGMK